MQTNNVIKNKQNKIIKQQTTSVQITEKQNKTNHLKTLKIFVAIEHKTKIKDFFC